MAGFRRPAREGYFFLVEMAILSFVLVSFLKYLLYALLYDFFLKRTGSE